MRPKDNRLSIAQRVLKVASLGKLPIGVEIENDDIDRAHKAIGKMFANRNRWDIGISKERDRGVLWFFQRK